LKEHGIVTARRDKQTIYYRIADLEWIRECPLLVKAPVHDLVER
jgi:DNA-binding transcriptional ArsR family regulator